MAAIVDGSHTTISYTVQTGVGVRVTTVTEVNDSAGVFIENQDKTSDYNILGELVSTTDDPGGESVKTDYDYYATGAPKTVSVDPNSANLQTSFAYDNGGHQSSITGPDIGTVSFLYTALGQLREQTDNAQNTTTFGYDVLGRLATQTDADGLASWTYDPSIAIGAIGTRT